MPRNTNIPPEISNQVLYAAPPNKSEHAHEALELRTYFHHNNTLCLIRQLLPFLIVLQRHRGASMAFLEGDTSFESKIIRLEIETTTRFSRISQLNESFDQLIPQQQWSDIKNEYDALMSHWREDTAIANFEFHNHFIELIIKLLQKLSAPVVDYTLKRSQPQSWKEGQLVAEITFHSTPQLIEAMAKVRGLVTHAAVAGQIDPHIHSRVKYLLQSIIQYKEKLRLALDDIQKETLSSTPGLFDAILHEHKIMQFHQLITDEFLIKKSIHTESHLIFDFISDVIELYSATVSLGLNLLQQSVDDAYAQSRGY